MNKVIRSVSYNVFGLRVGEVDDLLSGVPTQEPGITLSISAEFPWLKVMLQVSADNDAAAQKCLAPVAAVVEERLGDFCFSTGVVSMDDAVAELLRESRLTLSLAESCSGGLIAKRITDVPGSSGYFSEGVVTYSNGAKMRLLSVPAEILERCGAVSSECAAAMATGSRGASGSDIAIAVTGIAGPDGGSEEKPVGTVYVALATSEGCRTRLCWFGGNRDEIRMLTAWTALDVLRRYLKGRR